MGRREGWGCTDVEGDDRGVAGPRPTLVTVEQFVRKLFTFREN